MKVIPTPQPITITFDEEEAVTLRDILGRASHADRCKAFGEHNTDIFQDLYEALDVEVNR